MTFKKGANPFAKTSQEPLDLLESITAVELASCVPFVKIEKLDISGAVATDVRPLMYDLIQTPGFGSAGDSFGLDNDTFIERALVSLNSLTVEFEQQVGQLFYRQVTLEFIVHHPSIVFDRASKTSWREIMMEGKPFALEYGWRGDTGLVKNPLFNGEGHVTESGQVIRSTQHALLIISTYDLITTQTGEVKVIIKASENGDLALREMKFSDAFAAFLKDSAATIDDKFEATKARSADDADNFKALKSMLDRLVKPAGKGKDRYYLLGDILDNVVAPMVIAASKIWGYSSVELLLGKFNKDSGPQSTPYFSSQMKGEGIEDFKIPAGVLIDLLTKDYIKGRGLHLQQFISLLIAIVNKEGAWDKPPAGKSYQKPHVMMKSDTFRTANGIKLSLLIHDTTNGSHPFGILEEGKNRIAIDKQSKEAIFNKLRSLSVPILEFGRAGSMIVDASFKAQPDPLLQAIQTDAAYRDRKDRVQESQMTDVESRKGQSRGGELIVPVSILEGEIGMHGNFALEVFGQFWIEYFGSPEISGVYNVRGKTDVLEAGTFKSTFKVISEGIDPLNSRRKITDGEFAATAALAKKRQEDAKKKKRKGDKPGQNSRKTEKKAPPATKGTIVPRGS